MASKTQGTAFNEPAINPESGDEDTAPPPYTENAGPEGALANAVETHVAVTDDGRINIDISRQSLWLSHSIVSDLQTQLSQAQDDKNTLHHMHHAHDLPSPPSNSPPPPPILNIVMHVVGSRGDVQPFVALGRVLKYSYQHNVRLATHPVFQRFVEDNGLAFFSIGGDPAELMTYMVRSPGLLPSMDALLSGDVRRHRDGVYSLMKGCWRACIEGGNGLDSDTYGSPDATGSKRNRASSRPFVADVIIANPPSFAHIHCAQKLGVPLHLMFTMPWSSTQAFPHPLANIQPSQSDSRVVNYMSYTVVETLFWQGLGSIVNNFRGKILGLEPIRLAWGPRMASRLRIPYTYCWSPSLIPKPKDWESYITVAGFFFLPFAAGYTPDPGLAAFLAAGPPPVYIGFGSIIVDNPDALTKLLFEAIRQTGQRAVVSKGWGGLGSQAHPGNVFIIGDVPHDWLFKRVTCIVHHGGAGTTAAATAAGRPSVIVPFFGDQAFWGSMVWKAGLGPRPLLAKALTADLLATAINEALQPSYLGRARELGEVVAHERGVEAGAMSFHSQLDLESLRCSLAPHRAAVWEVKRRNVRLSAVAATALLTARLLRVEDLKLFRPQAYDLECPPWDPITGVLSACAGMVANMSKSLADIPLAVNRALHPHPAHSPPPNHAVSSSVRDASRIALGAATGLSRGVGRILLAGFRSPFEVTLAAARGFHHLPLLYGDQSVRKPERITGVVSGLQAVAKEITYSVSDGVAGLLTHPRDGARRGGAVGLAKGVGKGLGGMVVKPLAGGVAAWGVPGYTFEGVNKEMQRLYGSRTEDRIAVARLAQGAEEFGAADEREMRGLAERWRFLESGNGE